MRRKLGEQSDFHKKIAKLSPLSSSQLGQYGSLPMIETADDKEYVQPHYHSSKGWQLLPRSWEAVYLSSSDSFVLSRQEQQLPSGLDKVACSRVGHASSKLLIYLLE